MAARFSTCLPAPVRVFGQAGAQAGSPGAAAHRVAVRSSSTTLLSRLRGDGGSTRTLGPSPTTVHTSFRAQLPCRPQHPPIRTDGKRTARGVRVLYRATHAASAAPGMMKMGSSLVVISTEAVSGRRPITQWGPEPLSVWSGHRPVPGIVAPDPRGARGADVSLRDVSDTRFRRNSLWTPSLPR